MRSKEFNCIFVHIPKTARTSIEAKLGHFEEFRRGVQDHRTVKEIEPCSWRHVDALASGQIRLIGKRIRNTLKGRSPLLKGLFNKYYKFTFVRNPWSRVYSWYRNVMRDEIKQERLNVSPDCSFRRFLSNHSNQWALRPQMDWIENVHGSIPLDFIGRFENLQEDFAKVCDELGISDSDLPRLVSGGCNKSYKGVYNKDMKNTVDTKYQEEIETLGYKS